MTVEMAADKIINFRLCSRVEILELVHRLELDDIETIW